MENATQKQILDGNIFLDKDCSIEEIKKTCIDFIEENWENSIGGRNVKVKLYKSSDFKANILNYINISKYSSYMALLYESYTNSDIKLKVINNKLFKEFEVTDIEGISCVHSSILLLFILRYAGVDVNKLKYVQGFYYYDCADKFLTELLPCFKTQTGIHAFLSYLDGVIDVTSVAQQGCLYNFTTPFLLCTIPNGYNLYGYEETEDIVTNYAEKFRKINEFSSIEEWAKYHKHRADLFIEIMGK